MSGGELVVVGRCKDNSEDAIRIRGGLLLCHDWSEIISVITPTGDVCLTHNVLHHRVPSHQIVRTGPLMGVESFSRHRIKHLFHKVVLWDEVVEYVSSGSGYSGLGTDDQD